MKTPEISQRSIALDWDDETIWDHAVIERRAQKLRAEAAWAMTVAIREWVGKLFDTAKREARTVAPASLARRGHQPV